MSYVGSMTGGQVERFLPGDVVTCTVAAGQAATGGRLVELVTGDRTVQNAAAGSLKVLGVALFDAAAGEKVSVACVGVWNLRAEAAVAAGDYVAAAGTAGNVGSVSPGAFGGASVGLALAAIGAGSVGPVKLLRG
jgi:Uncharacterized conserved protein (DUF2190)